jgi:AAA domain
MPDGSGGGEPRTVILLSAEDDPGAVIRPRLEAAGAYLDRVVLLSMRTDSGTREPVISDADVGKMETAILSESAALLIVDPVVAYLPDGTDTKSDHNVRRVLGRLKTLAEHTGCAVVGIRHWRKSESENSLYRGGGSIAFSAAARSVLVVGRDPDDEAGRTRILASAKQNLAPIPPSLAFHLHVEPGSEVPRIEWEGVSGHSANVLTAANGEGKDRTKLQDGVAFLEEVLAEGPVPQTAVEAEAKAQEIAMGTLRRSKRKRGIVSEKSPDGSCWFWRLPVDNQGAHTFKSDHLPMNGTDPDDHLRGVDR